MSVLKYNSKNVDRTKGGGDAPAPENNAIVKCKVHQCKYEEGKTDDEGVEQPGKLINIYAVTEGTSKGFWFWDRISMGESSAWRLDQFLLACGIDTVGKPEGTFDPKKLVGKEIKVRAKVNGEYTNAGTLMPPGAPVDEKVRPGDGAPSEEDEQTWTEAGALIDAGDTDGEDAMNEAAIEMGLDPNAYDTWQELGEVMDGGVTGGDAPEPEPEPEEAADEVDYEALGAAADEGDEEAADKLTAAAEAAGLDPNDYGPWADLAAALAGDPFAD